jgi:hypothetical protein
MVMLLLNHHISVINCVTGGNAPVARSDAAFTATPQGTVFLFGGSISGTLSNDLFEFEPFNNTWRQLVNSGMYAPDPRGHSTLWMAPDGHLYLYGGLSSRKWIIQRMRAGICLPVEIDIQIRQAPWLETGELRDGRC